MALSWIFQPADDGGSGYANVGAVDSQNAGHAACGGDTWGICVTDNGGLSWYGVMNGPNGPQNSPYGRAAYFSKLAATSGRVYWGTGGLHSGTSGGWLGYTEQGSRQSHTIDTTNGFGTNFASPTGGTNPANLAPRPGCGRLIGSEQDGTTEYLYYAVPNGLCRVKVTGSGIGAVQKLWAQTSQCFQALAVVNSQTVIIAESQFTANGGTARTPKVWLVSSPTLRSDTTVTPTPITAAPAGGVNDIWVDPVSGNVYATDGTTVYWVHGTNFATWTNIGGTFFDDIVTSVVSYNDVIYVGQQDASQNLPTGHSIAKSSGSVPSVTWAWKTALAAVSFNDIGLGTQWWLTTKPGYVGYLGGGGHDVSVLDIDQATPTNLYTFGRGGCWLTRNGGTSWNPSMFGLNGSTDSGITITPSAVWTQSNDWTSSKFTGVKYATCTQDNNPPAFGAGGATFGPITLNDGTANHSYTFTVKTSSTPGDITVSVDGGAATSIADTFFKGHLRNFSQVKVTADGFIFITMGAGGTMLGVPSTSGGTGTGTASGTSATSGIAVGLAISDNGPNYIAQKTPQPYVSPTLTSPITITMGATVAPFNLDTDSHTYNLNSNQDYILLGPNRLHYGSITINPGNNSKILVTNLYKTIGLSAGWARLFTNTPNANSKMVFAARSQGVAGNSIRIRFVVAGNSTPLSVSESGTDITVNVATNSSGVATSTAAQVQTAILARTGAGQANTLIEPDFAPGNSGAGVVGAFAFTNLSGGSASAIDDPLPCISTTAQESGALNIKVGDATNSTVYFEGVHIDGTAGPNSPAWGYPVEQDGFRFSCPGVKIWMKNCRVENLIGGLNPPHRHADCIQPDGGALEIHTEDCYFNSHYQGLYFRRENFPVLAPVYAFYANRVQIDGFSSNPSDNPTGFNTTVGGTSVTIRGISFGTQPSDPANNNDPVNALMPTKTWLKEFYVNPPTGVSFGNFVHIPISTTLTTATGKPVINTSVTPNTLTWPVWATTSVPPPGETTPSTNTTLGSGDAKMYGYVIQGPAPVIQGYAPANQVGLNYNGPFTNSGAPSFPIVAPDTTGWTQLPNAQNPYPGPNSTWAPNLSDTTDYVINLPVGVKRTRPITITGGRNVYIPFCWIEIDTNGLGQLLQVGDGPAGRVITVAHCLMDSALTNTEGGTISPAIGYQCDGFKSHGNSDNLILMVKTCRIQNLSGHTAGVHADLFQSSAGCGEFWVEDFTGVTMYDGFMMQREANVENQTVSFSVTAGSVTGNNYTFTSPNHTFVVGDPVGIWGCSPNAYNGGFTVNGVSGSGTTKQFTVRKGDSSPGPLSTAGNVEKEFFAYNVGSIFLNRVNVRGTNNPFGDPSSALQSIRFGARNAPVPNPGSINQTGFQHANEDQTPFNLEWWDYILDATNWYLQPPGSQDIGQFVEPDSATSNWSGIRPVLDTTTTPDQLTWPLHPGVTPTTKAITGAPPGGDFCTVAQALGTAVSGTGSGTSATSGSATGTVSGKTPKFGFDSSNGPALDVSHPTHRVSDVPIGLGTDKIINRKIVTTESATAPLEHGTVTQNTKNGTESGQGLDAITNRVLGRIDLGTTSLEHGTIFRFALVDSGIGNTFISSRRLGEFDPGIGADVSSLSPLINSFEATGVSNGTTLTFANSATSGYPLIVSPSSNPLPVYDGTQFAHGAFSAQLNVPQVTGVSIDMYWPINGFAQQRDGYGRAYIRFNTLTLPNFIIQDEIPGGLGLHNWGIGTDSSGHLVIRDQGNNVAATSTTLLLVNTWYRVEWHRSNSSPLVVRLYTDMDSQTIAETLTAVPPSTYPVAGVSVNVHFVNLISNTTLWFDDIGENGVTWLGPVGATILGRRDSGFGFDSSSIHSFHLDISTGLDVHKATSPVVHLVPVELGAGIETIAIRRIRTENGVGLDISALHLNFLLSDIGTAVDASVSKRVAPLDLGVGLERSSKITRTIDLGVGSDGSSRRVIGTIDLGAATDKGNNRSTIHFDFGVGIDHSANRKLFALDITSGIESKILTVPFSKTDSGTGVDTSRVRLSRSDSGSGSEVSSETAIIHATDTAVGIESSSVIKGSDKTFLLLDLGLASEYIQKATINLESAIATELTTERVSMSKFESFSQGIDISHLFLTYALTDTGSGADFNSRRINVKDTSTDSESSVVLQDHFRGTESGSGLDTSSFKTRFVTTSDVTAGIDSGFAINRSFAVFDTSTSINLSTLFIHLASTDTALGTDFSGIKYRVLDTGTELDDAIILSFLFRVTDIGHSVNKGTRTGLVIGKKYHDRAIVISGAYVRAKEKYHRKRIKVGPGPDTAP